MSDNTNFRMLQTDLVKLKNRKYGMGRDNIEWSWVTRFVKTLKGDLSDSSLLAMYKWFVFGSGNEDSDRYIESLVSLIFPSGEWFECVMLFGNRIAEALMDASVSRARKRTLQNALDWILQGVADAGAMRDLKGDGWAMHCTLTRTDKQEKEFVRLTQAVAQVNTNNNADNNNPEKVAAQSRLDAFLAHEKAIMSFLVESIKKRSQDIKKERMARMAETADVNVNVNAPSVEDGVKEELILNA